MYHSVPKVNDKTGCEVCNMRLDLVLLTLESNERVAVMNTFYTHERPTVRPFVRLSVS